MCSNWEEVMRSLFRFSILVVTASFISGCGSSSSSSSSPQAPACSADFIDSYNAVSQSVKGVSTDLDNAYGASKPTDPDLLLDAQQKAYQDAQSCKAQAMAFENRYRGIQCTALLNGNTKTVDANATMDQVIQAMSTVPVPSQPQPAAPPAAPYPPAY